ncbi:hypothetical protein ACHAXM_005096 [Skeletonema potamos]
MNHSRNHKRWCSAAALIPVCIIFLLFFSVSTVAFSTSKLQYSAAATEIKLTHLQENIIVEEAELNQKVDENLTILFAARISRGDDENSLSTCEGLLFQKNNEDRIHHYQAHITCSHDDDINDNDVDHLLAVFHKLLIQYLVIENDLYEDQLRNNDSACASLSISLESNDDATTTSELHMHLCQIGFSFPADNEESICTNDGIRMDLSKYEPFLNSFIIRHRGTEQGNASLILHKMLCARRVSYQFSNNDDNAEQSEASSIRRRQNVVSHHPSILSPSVIDEVNDILDVVKTRKWLSTNPDSVDGLPSLHLNLITNGKPLFDDIEEETSPDNLSTFPQCISSLVKMLRPHLYNNLLPAARKVLNSSTLEVSDVFIRSYGVQPGQHEGDNADSDEDIQSKTRFSLSPHFDVTAYATCVMALDAIASSGKQGLYTIPPTNGFHTSSAVLKKFFPLKKGDGVLHTFDILHGVDVDQRLNQPRTSLIVWFTDSGSIGDKEDVSSNVNQPWLLNPSKDDEIGQFVLALASERTVEEDGSHLRLKSAVDPLQLYISSAEQGNVFAMTALGQMCDDGAVPDSQCEIIRDFLFALDNTNPYLHSGELAASRSNKLRCKCEALADALWYHAAIHGGHRVAQVSLADNLMLSYITERDNLTPQEAESMILVASVLLTMALHQGYNSSDMLHRIKDVECSRLNDAGVEIPSDAFFQSAVIQVLLLSM